MATTFTTKRLVTSTALLVGLLGAVVGRVEALEWPVRNFRVNVEHDNCVYLRPNEQLVTATFSWDPPNPYGLFNDGTTDTTNNGLHRPLNVFHHWVTIRPRPGSTCNHGSWYSKSNLAVSPDIIPTNWDCLKDSYFLENHPNYNEAFGNTKFTIMIETVPLYYTQLGLDLWIQNSITQTFTVDVSKPTNLQHHAATTCTYEHDALPARAR